MSNFRLIRCLALVPLLCAAGASQSLTIGRHQGQAVLGRSLEIQMPVGLDAGMDPADICPEAEVSYGDQRVSPRLVDVQVSGTGDSLQVRLRVAQPLDEPFASVQLRIGCTQKLSRRYVLLAEEPAADSPVAVAPAAPVAVESIKPNSVPSAIAAAPLPGLAVTPASRPKAVARAERPARELAPAASAGGGARPRLKLEALEIRVAPAASAASAPAMATPAVRSASAEAASAPAAPAADEAGRVQALEAEVRNLQEALRRSQAAAADMRARNHDSDRDRFANPLVYGLVAMVILSMALAALAWRRATAKRSAAWWQDAGASARPAAAPIAPAAPVAAAEPAAGTRKSGASPEPLRASSLIATGRVPGSGSQAIEAPAAPPAADARATEPLSLSTNELSDIQQEADFFVSLGEYDRAIEVLRNHIEIHPQASALAWLDLLEIQHKLGRKDDYEQLRRDFEWLFNARVPAFEDFDLDQNGLEDHPALLARIQALWPEPAVLEVIDAGIFRTPADGKNKQLGLQAYRDLLFLHQLARELGGGGEAAAAAETLVVEAAPPPGPWPTTEAGSALAGTAPAFSGPGAGGAGALSAAATALSQAPSVPGPTGRSLDINLDEVLAQPASATDPHRDRDSRGAVGQGLDQLLNFDLDVGHPDDAPPGQAGSKATGS